jgi:hypothetical protein
VGAIVNGRTWRRAPPAWRIGHRSSASAQQRRYGLVPGIPALARFARKSGIFSDQAPGTVDYRQPYDCRNRHTCTSPGRRSS